MLLFVTVSSLLSFTFAEVEEKPMVHLSPADLKVVKEAAADCVKELEVNQKISDNFFKLRVENDTDSKKFLYCLCRKSNYLDEEGHLNEAVVPLFEGTDLKDEVEKVIDNCNKIKENDKIETTYKVIMCFYKDTPVLIGQ